MIPNLIPNINKFKIDFLYSYILSLYLALSIVRFLHPANLMLSSTLVLLGLLPVIIHIQSQNYKVENYFFILLIISTLISSAYTGSIERIPHKILFSLMSLGILVLFEQKKISYKQLMTVFIFVCLYFLGLMLFRQDPVYTLKVCSGNGISMILLVSTVSLYIVRHRLQRAIILWPAAISFLICFWAGGRSGIISSFIILFGINYLKLKNKKFTRLFYLTSFYLFLALITFSFYDYLRDFYFFKAPLSRFANHSLSEEPRFLIWANYFNNLDLERFIFGVNTGNDPWPEKVLYNFDYHNSFIFLHSKTGIFGFFILLLMVNSLIYYIRNNLLFFILFTAIIFRAFTDSFIFFESWDFIFFFFLIKPLKAILRQN